MPSQVSFLGAEQAVDAEGRFTSPVLQKLNAVAKSQATGSFATIAYVDEQVAAVAGIPGSAGRSIYAASGSPTVSANVGDLYIDTATGDLWQRS